MFNKYIIPAVLVIILAVMLFTIDLWKSAVALLLLTDNYIIFVISAAVIAGLIGLVYSRLAYKVDNDPSLAHAEQDRQSFKKFSLMNIALIIAFYFALGSILLVTLNHAPVWLAVTSVIVLLFAVVIRYYGYSLINTLYPERELPNSFEPDFDDRLIQSLNKEEMLVIFTGLYNAFKLTNILLPAAMLVITLYGYATGQSQHFALCIIAVSAMLINIIYQLTVRKMI
ncbi:hypothetical protein [Macrococcus equipercicus]|uniref:DUF3169 family protein n=1 Tax=Macrococcus equipercicus TaxID=69967 RepID=A0A9Q9F1Q3_9STAP|nr:hypothetical protein [Macrococcus equipercicus]KAA1039295.1 hypothetical protein ERX35_006905 [Macrococcus equipercicus]UTH13586.1 hypothetical protein KFV11_10230 [Macrococcus equipercicus]